MSRSRAKHQMFMLGVYKEASAMPFCKRCMSSEGPFKEKRLHPGEFQKQCIPCNLNCAAKRREWIATPSGQRSIKKTEPLRKALSKEWRKTPAGKLSGSIISKEWREKNEEYNRERMAEWEASDHGKATRKIERSSEHRMESRRQHENHRRATDPRFALVKGMRDRMYQTLLNTRYSATFFQYAVDFASSQDVAEHILGLGAPLGFTFETYGKEWHVDHKIPCFWYDFLDEDDIVRCWRKKNLQPLSCHENQTKSSKLQRELLDDVGVENWPASWKGVPPTIEEENAARRSRMRFVRV